MKKFTLISLILLAMLVSACNYPGSDNEESSGESNDSMATEIARILTGTPVQIDVEPTSPEDVKETIAPEPTEVPEEETVAPEPEETDSEPTQTEEEEETPTATPTPTNTPTTTPTEPLADTDPAKTLGEPDWVNAMGNGDGWPTGFNKFSTIVFEDGYLKLTADTELDGWRLTWPFLEDFYLEYTVQSPECKGNDHFGMMFRVPANAKANKGYLYGITCDGKYGLRRWDGQTMFSPVQWTASDAINTKENAINKLGVMAEGENLTLYINGKKIKELTNDAYLKGSFGVFVGGTNVEDLTVWVDQIRYWVIP